MMSAAVIQIIGFVGVALLFATFQVNNRKYMLRIFTLAQLVFVLHFYLLGGYTGAAMNLVSAFRAYSFERFRQHNSIFWIFLILISLMAALTWQGWVSLLPAIGSGIGTVALWQKNPRYIRLLSLLVSPFWFAYNFLTGSYAGMTGDSIAFISVAIAIYRFDVRKLPNSATSQSEKSGA